MAEETTISDRTRMTLGLAGTLLTVLAVAILAYSRLVWAEARLTELERLHPALRLQRIEDKLDSVTRSLEKIEHRIDQPVRSAGGR